MDAAADLTRQLLEPMERVEASLTVVSAADAPGSTGRTGGDGLPLRREQKRERKGDRGHAPAARGRPAPPAAAQEREMSGL